MLDTDIDDRHIKLNDCQQVALFIVREAKAKDGQKGKGHPKSG